MKDDVIKYVLYFKDFIWVSIAVGVILMVAFWAMTRHFSWNRRQRALYGFFMNRSDRELVSVSVSFLQFMFVISSLVAGTNMELPHLLMLIMLALVKLGAGGEIFLFLRDVINSGLVFSALFVVNILTGYLKETRFNIYVVIILISLAVFLIAYSFYFFVKDLSDVKYRERVKRVRVKKERVKRERHIGRIGRAGRKEQPDEREAGEV